MIKLAVRHIVSETGERLKVLIDSSSGLPVFYPNLYSTSQIRGAAKSVATIQSYFTSIKVLYSWAIEYSVDIEERWRQAEWLKVWEIDSLRDYCSSPLRLHSGLKSKISNISNRRPVTSLSVNVPTKYIRMTFIADYLRWLAELLMKTSSRTLKNEMDLMYKNIKSHRPKKCRVYKSQVDKEPEPAVLKEVLMVLKPGCINNPYKDYSLQIRNAVIIALLYYLGIRRGELLNIRVDDVNFVTNEIRIIRRADSSMDNRIYQPLVKTEERVLPLSEQLVEIINEYVINYRTNFLRARRHPYLFVTHKQGPHQGKPLSNSGFGKVMSSVQKIAEEFSSVHAHTFRHNWNYIFSKTLDENEEKCSPEREEQIRSYLMGWKETSGTAATYNKRHIKEKAREAILEFQNGIINKGGI
ncbi:site-specific integrase [Salmonella enterica]|uniref:tyrosine-type recombinase/integrase n=1 Tax=Salmonella enterica TaxID=28901 RepID=UPI0009ACFCA1|nr:site-specific integrase [Salmonella enterica]EGI8358196.1 site-specific integrase [Salmonella enterica]